ncbi:DinB family protein [Chitinophaga lutea]
MTNNVATPEKQTFALTPAMMLEHLQGHRNLTRRTIEAFPEDQLFSFSVGGMRPFSQLAMELIMVSGFGAEGLASGEWLSFQQIGEKVAQPKTKAELLELWDTTSQKISDLWPAITATSFAGTHLAFQAYESTGYAMAFYMVDNEIHHRGQGFVYLRALGIEPPFFWER